VRQDVDDAGGAGRVLLTTCLRVISVTVFCSIEGCGKMSTTGAALGLSALASLRCLDASWLGGELGPESDDEATQGALRVGSWEFARYSIQIRNQGLEQSKFLQSQVSSPTTQGALRVRFIDFYSICGIWGF